MKYDKDAVVLICAPTDGEAVWLPGRVTDSCAECEQEIWLAPSGQRIREKHNAVLLCISCGIAAIKATPDAIVKSPTLDQQQDSVNTWLRERL